MRVNLSYSVELEEVLSEVSSLFAREKEKFINADRKAMNVMKEKFSDEQIESVITTIEEYKKALVSFDIKLSEVQQILKGYHDILNSPSEVISIEEDSEIEQVEELSNLIGVEDET